jgi:hypothetical protein
MPATSAVSAVSEAAASGTTSSRPGSSPEDSPGGNGVAGHAAHKTLIKMREQITPIRDDMQFFPFWLCLRWRYLRFDTRRAKKDGNQAQYIFGDAYTDSS